MRESSSGHLLLQFWCPLAFSSANVAIIRVLCDPFDSPAKRRGRSRQAPSAPHGARKAARIQSSDFGMLNSDTVLTSPYRLCRSSASLLLAEIALRSSSHTSFRFAGRSLSPSLPGSHIPPTETLGTIVTTQSLSADITGSKVVSSPDTHSASICCKIQDKGNDRGPRSTRW